MLKNKVGKYQLDGDAVRIALASNHISIDELAELLETTAVSVYRMLRGDQTITLEKLLFLASLFQTTPRSLIFTPYSDKFFEYYNCVINSINLLESDKLYTLAQCAINELKLREGTECQMTTTMD